MNCVNACGESDYLYIKKKGSPNCCRNEIVAVYCADLPYNF